MRATLRSPSRGFVTMATGRDEYYILASNLLVSYKRFNSNPLPFAIICDRKNEYTESFDDVVMLDNPSCSFLDKLRLVDLAPYDETIFIDADSLVYKCLDGLWDVVKDAPDFGIFGAVLDPESPLGRIEIERSGRLRERMRFPCICQGGMYFIRRSPVLRDFLELCQDILTHFSEFQKPRDPYPSDDTIFPLACSVFGFRPPEDWWRLFCFYPESKIYGMDIKSGFLDYVWTVEGERLGPECFFVHFSVKGTREWPYKREAYRLKCLSEGKRPSISRLAAIWCLSELKRWVKRMIR